MICLLTLSAMILSANLVYAKEKPFSISNEDRAFLSQYLDDFAIDHLTPGEYQMVMSDPENVKVSYSNETGIMPIAQSCVNRDNCFSNGDMVFYVYYLQAGKRYSFHIINIWNVLPAVKSFDVLAWRWSNPTFEIEEYDANQSSASGYVNYSLDGTNTKHNNYGIGTSMNVLNDAYGYLQLDIAAIGHFTSTAQNTFTGTMQHAIQSVTLAESQSYSFDSLGLGGVLLYNNTIKAKYTAFPGFSLTVNPVI